MGEAAGGDRASSAVGSPASPRQYINVRCRCRMPNAFTIGDQELYWAGRSLRHLLPRRTALKAVNASLAHCRPAPSSMFRITLTGRDTT